MCSIGARIKKLRAENKITQQKLGDVLGVVQKQISKIETGSNMATISQLRAISNYFGVSIDYLVNGVDQKLTPVESELITMIREDQAVYKSLVGVLDSKKKLIGQCASTH